MSVTGVFFRMGPEGDLRVTHAGHPPLLVLPFDGSPIVRFEKGGCPLGMFADEPVPYEEEHYRLRRGDRLFAYTDAALEWGNRAGEPFGADRLIAVLDQSRNRPVEAINTACLDAFESHADGQRCPDDLTMVCVEYTGPLV